ncbi:hypothetical protein N431DRAFT_438760 [Stipitochalara longipes BDJ]|nr:hypothetical protein N431DRAFT_438760 [Stipitochalara longipes BDJ]
MNGHNVQHRRPESPTAPRILSRDASRRFITGPATTQHSGNSVHLLPRLPIVYPYRDREARWQLQQLDNESMIPFVTSRYEQVREANKGVRGGHAGGLLTVPTPGLQRSPNFLPYDPVRDQAPLGTVTRPTFNVEPAQGSLANPVPAFQIITAPRGLPYNPTRNQHFGPSAGNATIFSENASIVSSPMVPELSEDGESATSEALLTPPSLSGSPNDVPASSEDVQPSLTVGRAKIPSIDEPMVSILGDKMNPLSVFVESGLVFNPITGRYRERQMIDDFPGLTREKHRHQWDMFMRMERAKRPSIEAYEEGDSDLDLTEWEEKKEMRRSKDKDKKRKLSRH